MATYSITVKMSNAATVLLRTGKVKICLAKKMGPGENDYNIVFQALDPMETNIFKWTESYAMGTTDKTFEPMGLVKSNPEVPISFQSLMTLEENNSHPITPDKDMKPNSFSFINNGAQPINVVISCATEGDAFLPIHITPTPVIPSMEMNFTPLAKMVVWVQSSVTTSTMIQHGHGKRIEIDLTKVHDREIHYGERGDWSVSAPPTI